MNSSIDNSGVTVNQFAMFFRTNTEHVSKGIEAGYGGWDSKCIAAFWTVKTTACVYMTWLPQIAWQTGGGEDQRQAAVRNTGIPQQPRLKDFNKAAIRQEQQDDQSVRKSIIQITEATDLSVIPNVDNTITRMACVRM